MIEGRGDFGDLSIALITAAVIDDCELLAKLINQLRMDETGGVIAALCGLTAGLVEHSARTVGVTTQQFLHTLGIENANNSER